MIHPLSGLALGLIIGALAVILYTKRIEILTRFKTMFGKVEKNVREDISTAKTTVAKKANTARRSKSKKSGNSADEKATDK